MAHNWNQWFIMGLIELWRALGSHWYLNHPDAHYKDESLRDDLLRLVSRLHRNFVNRLEIVGDGADAHFFWHYNDGLPEIAGIPFPFIPHAEDTSHGALDMRGLGVLYDNLPQLSAAAAAGEPIELDETHLGRFANTFLKKIAAGSNFAQDVTGRPADPVDKRNYACDGWLNLAVVDARVYRKCYEVSLRVVNGKQPYLGIGNHSALLRHKQWLTNDPPPPKLCKSGWKCCEADPDGVCNLCVPLKAECP
jgi:hypothetical protein